MTFRDASGAFNVEGLVAGAYVVEVVADGFTGASVAVKVEPGVAVEGVVIGLEEGIALRGRIIAKGTSEPLPDATIYLLPLAEREDQTEERGARRQRDRDAGAERGSRAGRSSPNADATLALTFLSRARSAGQGQRAEADGTFRLSEVAEGRYVVVVEHDGFLPLSREVDVALGVLSEYVFTLDPGESLEGRISLGRAAGAGVTVIIEAANGVSQRAETDAQGRYKVSGLLPGTYGVRILDQSTTIAEGLSAEVKDGKKNELDYKS